MLGYHSEELKTQGSWAHSLARVAVADTLTHGELQGHSPYVKQETAKQCWKKNPSVRG